MIVLAMDTAGPDCSAALYDSNSDSILSEVTENIGRGHAEKLMAVVDLALAEAGLELGAVERIAITIGPGSFTGIRVGVAAARGFALSLGVPAVGVPTLAVLAMQKRMETPGVPVLAAMDAKRGEVHAQSFDADGRPTTEPAALAIADAIALARDFPGAIAGSAGPLLRGEEASGGPDRFPISIVARLASTADTDSGPPSPLYLRGPDAKPQSGFAIPRI